MSSRTCPDWPRLMEIDPDLQFKHYTLAEAKLPTEALVNITDVSQDTVAICCDLERHVSSARNGEPPTAEQVEKGPYRVRVAFEMDAVDADVLRDALRMLRGLAGDGAAEVDDGTLLAEMARRVGDWLLARPFDTYGATNHHYDRFHYSAYYCSNAMAQLGGDYWRKFFPTLSKTLLDAQSPDGSWLAESGEDSMYGPAYPTALSVLTLTPAYQLLPIYQR